MKTALACGIRSPGRIPGSDISAVDGPASSFKRSATEPQDPVLSAAFPRWILLALLTVVLCEIACLTPAERSAAEKTGGDPRRGIEAIRRFGCPACHTIPGIKEAIGRIGPPLSGLASRRRIAETLENNPKNLIRWIRNPRSINRYTSMPVLNMDESEARDIAAYLYTLK